MNLLRRNDALRPVRLAVRVLAQCVLEHVQGVPDAAAEAVDARQEDPPGAHDNLAIGGDGRDGLGVRESGAHPVLTFVLRRCIAGTDVST